MSVVQQGTAAERSHLQRGATGGGVIQLIVLQPFTASARPVTAVPTVVGHRSRDWLTDMTSPDEIERRRNAALAAIRRAHGTAADEHGATLFVSHHLDELGDEFWLKHCGVARPEPVQVLDILVLQSHWGEDGDDGIDTFDYTLPDDATNYIISVSFDERGSVSGVTMES